MAKTKKTQGRSQRESARVQASPSTFVERVGEKFEKDAAKRLAQNEEWRRQSRQSQAVDFS